MKLLIGLVALSVYSVSTTPTPQLFGPLSSVGNFFQNTIQGFPRPPFFQNGFAFGPFRPQTQQVLNPPQQMAAQQIIPAQENAQSFNVPIRQISNNGWYWQNWIPMPVIPQYPADQSPTIIIISHPSKPQTAENPNPNPTDTASSIQSTNNSAVVPTTNESTNSTTLSTPTPVSNSSESSTTAPLPAVAQSSAATTEGSNSITSPENITNVPDLGLTILNPVVPLAPLEPTTNASLPETTAQ